MPLKNENVAPTGPLSIIREGNFGSIKTLVPLLILGKHLLTIERKKKKKLAGHF